MLTFIEAIGNNAFLQRALIVGLLVSLCSALLGISLVLKRYSMIGDGLSHVGFGAMAIAAAMNAAPLIIAVPVVIAAAFVLLSMRSNSKINSDAAIAMFSTSALAIGMVAVYLSSGVNGDINSYMYGSILALDRGDVMLSIVLAAIVLALYIVMYNRIFAVTFDENFAQATGVHAWFYNMLIAVLTAITIVLGMRMMGTLLISALLIFPSLTSMRVCGSFRGVVVCSALLSAVSFFSGIMVSYLYSTPTGASVVIANLILFIIFSAVGAGRKLIKRS